MKEKLIHELCLDYLELESAPLIAVCFEREGVPFCKYTNVLALEPFMELTTASAHHASELVMRLCKLNKRLLAFLSEGCFQIGTTDELQKALEATASGGRFNRGLAYEKLFTEFNRKKWSRDSVAWWKAPDITLGLPGFEYGVQVKSPRATFTSKAQIERIRKELAR